MKTKYGCQDLYFSNYFFYTVKQHRGNNCCPSAVDVCILPIYQGVPTAGKTSLSVGLATNPPILYTFTKPKVATDLAAGIVLLAVPQ